MNRRSVLATGVVIGLIGVGRARADSLHLFSYDPANAETRAAAGPLTFEFRKGMLHTTLLSVHATDAEASAELRRTDEKAVGAGGLSPLIGAAASERDLYAVEPDREGAALISAFCPGASRAWMSFGALRNGRDLRVFVLGNQTGGGAARLCRTLDFTFHGEWRGPPGAAFDTHLLDRPTFPK